MAKQRKTNSLLGTVGNQISSLLGWGGWLPPGARTNNPGTGSWLPLGEPSASGTIQQNGVFWGPIVLSDTLGGGPTCSILMESPRQTLGQNAAPLLMRLTMALMDGNIDILNITSNNLTAYGPGVAYQAQIGVGIYLSKLNASTNLYDSQDPLGGSDASRFDWLYLESRSFDFVNFNSTSQPVAYPANWMSKTEKMFDLLNVDLNVDITPGTALMLALNAYGLATGAPYPTGTNTLNVSPQIRGFLTRAAA